MNGGDDELTEDELESIDRILFQALNIKATIDALILAKLDDLPNSYVRLLSRVKTKKSLIEKIKRKRRESRERDGSARQYSVRDVTDIVGFRLVCHFQPDIVKVVKLLAEMINTQIGFDGMYERARLYTTPSPNQSALLSSVGAVFGLYDLPFEPQAKDSRYTSLHLTCRLRDFKNFPPIEIQIRNVFEEAWSSIEHASKYKGRKVSATVSRHLTVLATLIQGCVEYAEAIRIDMDDGSSDEAPTITPLITYHEDLMAFSPMAQKHLASIMDLRANDKHADILSKIAELRAGSGKHLFDSEDVRYFLEMEEALSQLKLDNFVAAQSLYEGIIQRNPLRAMVSYRLAETHRSKQEFLDALRYVRQAENQLANGKSSKKELEWLQIHLPLTKAYYLWQNRDAKGAYRDLSASLKRLPQNVEVETRQKYVNSTIYYHLEAALEDGTIDLEQLRTDVAQMKKLKMDSVTNAIPEAVDTYAWACHHIGDSGEAKRAIQEVLGCMRFVKNEGRTEFFHNGKGRAISANDLNTIYEHVRVILSQ